LVSDIRELIPAWLRPRNIENRIDLICEDEATAKERAEQLVDGQYVELWQGDRKIATFAKH
jgi:hypothetical protein